MSRKCPCPEEGHRDLRPHVEKAVPVRATQHHQVAARCFCRSAAGAGHTARLQGVGREKPARAVPGRQVVGHPTGPRHREFRLVQPELAHDGRSLGS